MLVATHVGSSRPMVTWTLWLSGHRAGEWAREGVVNGPPAWLRAHLWRGVINYLITCENLSWKVSRKLLVFPGMQQELTNPSVKRSTNLLSRRDLYLLVGYPSGHHLTKTRLSSYAKCRFRKQYKETTKHILYDCAALVWTWRKHLHLETKGPKHIVRSSTKDLLCFIREAEQLLSR